MFFLMLACATGTPVTLTWHTETAPCEDGHAAIDVPDPTPLMLGVRLAYTGERDVTAWSSSAGTDADGRVSVECAGDEVVFTYALASE
jgi:hypothetical protein